MTKTVAFFGASTGVGLSALKHSLAAGHQCIALCRIPSKLTAIFPAEATPNLKIVQGDAKDVSAVSQCLQDIDGKLVDQIVSTIGGRPVISKMSIDDPEVCRKGIAALFEALAQLRRNGVTGQPHIIICSTTGISRFGRDIPIAMIPLYHVLLKVPHADKRILEESLVTSDEDYTIVRASLLTDGETTTDIRVGIEDPKTGTESKAIGYTISREDAGRWIAENLLLKRDTKYLKKIATITY
ncbi:MAG: hypothetical protein M1818_004490 [Claussenomyces sp. TS43310]|nr:MAG: hypothetical protein M1818_004490 [Claussenomyces sp. TS43310]